MKHPGSPSPCNDGGPIKAYPNYTSFNRTSNQFGSFKKKMKIRTPIENNILPPLRVIN